MHKKRQNAISMEVTHCELLPRPVAGPLCRCRQSRMLARPQRPAGLAAAEALHSPAKQCHRGDGLGCALLVPATAGQGSPPHSITAVAAETPQCAYAGRRKALVGRFAAANCHQPSERLLNIYLYAYVIPLSPTTHLRRLVGSNDGGARHKVSIQEE